jgi:hypothetical protein
MSGSVSDESGAATREVLGNVELCDKPDLKTVRVAYQLPRGAVNASVDLGARDDEALGSR